MGLVLDWQQKLGYNKDPFGDLRPVHEFMVGLGDLQERLNLFLIKDERFGTISGAHGTGKTLLLQWMNDELAPQKTHAQHYIDVTGHKREQIVDALLASRLGLLERKLRNPLNKQAGEKEQVLLRKLAKEQRNVLLIDNAGSLGASEVDLVTTILSRTPSHVVLADTPERLHKLKLPPDTLKLTTPSYTHEELAEMLKRRIAAVGGMGIHPFSDDVTRLAKQAKDNPAKFLSLARERAIELSLKVPAVVPQKSKSFSISVKKISVPDYQGSKKKKEEHADVDLLAQALGAPTHRPPVRPTEPEIIELSEPASEITIEHVEEPTQQKPKKKRSRR